MALTNQPAVQVRAVCGVANTERPHVAVPALNRAGDRVRTDPRPERLSGVFPALIALAASEDRTLTALLAEALDMLFQSRQMPTIAQKPDRPPGA